VSLCAELLEDRLLPSGLPVLSPKLIGDFSGAAGFTQVNNLVFFSADVAPFGTELLASPGTGSHVVADINPGPTGSYPKYLTNVNGLLFFQANDGIHGVELWATDGTQAGTLMVDINPKSASSYPHSLTNVNGTLFFAANDGTHGSELWENNGTVGGTFLVKDINPGASDSSPGGLTNVNGTLFFNANDGTHGTELWKSNGTAAGTALVADINPGSASSYPYRLTNVNGTLFFGAIDGTHGGELWASNGTAAGTFLVKDINPGTAYSYPAHLANVNGTVFFQALDGTHGFELWESNGTAAGTFLVADINPGIYDSTPNALTNANGTLFFSANDGPHGFELWQSNGTPAGTFLVKDINPGASNSAPTYLTNVDGTLFFEANDGTHGGELWQSNGTAAGTALVADINPGKASSYPRYLMNANGDLFFSAVDAAHGREPWSLPLTSTSVSSSPNPSGFGDAVTFTATLSGALDLVPEGTVDFKEGNTDLTPGGASLVAGQATFSISTLALGSHVITAFYSGDGNFSAGQGDDSANRQVVRTTKLLLDINPGTPSSLPSSFTQVNNLTFFAADNELWVSDGSAAGTTAIGPAPSGLTNVNGTLFFAANDGTHGKELWASNGSAAGTFMVADINPGTSGSYPGYLTNVNGTLFFTANDGTHGKELWESTGSAAGTFMVQDIAPGAADSAPSQLTNVNGTLFFSANDGSHGYELWESNGSAAGTFLVQDINPGLPPSSYPDYLTNVNGTLFFAAYDGTHGTELWESTGPGRTFLVSDINPGPGGSDPGDLTNVNGTLFFEADDGTHGQELWASDGSAAGTQMVKDIRPANGGNPDSYSSYPRNLANVNGTLFFSADDGVTGQELWKSNGSADGTVLVKDIFPGIDPTFQRPLSSYPYYLTNVNGTLFFEANDGTHGPELWESNGTSDGTVLVDINPGSTGSNPRSLTNGNGNLFFSADDGTHGVEPWIVVSTATTTVLSSTPNPSAFGQAATFTATIGVVPGLPAPTGTVDFKEGSTDLTPGGVSLTNGQATFSTTALAAGSHTITAFYSGDINFQASQEDDSASPQVVNKDSTNTHVFASPSSLVSGQAVALAAVVSNTSGPFGTPTGAVQFAVDGSNLGAPVALNNGVATLPTRLFAAGGPHTITATYTNNDGNFGGSGKSVTQAVAKAGTKTILISTPTAAVSGQVVVFTAIINPVAPGTGTPTGRVDFKEGATDLTPGGVTMAGGKATFTTSSLALGSHTVTASYGGDSSFTGSTGNDVDSLVVNKASTRTVMTSFPDPSVFGQVVSFTVAVIALAPSQGTPTGTVTFLDGTKTIGSVTLNSTGRATFTTASLSLGNHAINANYSGTGTFLASADTNFGETVQKAATTTTVAASANQAVVGTTITFTATLQPTAPGAGTPTGTVTFKDNTTVLGTAMLTSGQATFTTSALAVGTHAINARYGGDTNFLTSFSPNLAEVVSASLQTALVSPPPTNSTRSSAAPTSLPLARLTVLDAQSVDDLFAASGSRRGLSMPAARPHASVGPGAWLDW
jgi:ELWxxDGT repeat protein